MKKRSKYRVTFIIHNTTFQIKTTANIVITNLCDVNVNYLDRLLAAIKFKKRRKTF